MQITVNVTKEGNGRRPISRAFKRLAGPRRTLLILIGLLAPAAVALSQDRPPAAAVASSQENPISAHNRMVYAGMKHMLLRAAEKMPEENYKFKPTETVRSFGQILGHIADSHYTFVSVVLGEKNPDLKIEQTKTSKANLISALKDAFAYCDPAYNSMTDASAAQMVKAFGSEAPKLGMLSVNNVHNAGHYGNLVTYLRMKNIVPPSSEPGVMPQPKK